MGREGRENGKKTASTKQSPEETKRGMRDRTGEKERRKWTLKKGKKR